MSDDSYGLGSIEQTARHLNGSNVTESNDCFQSHTSTMSKNQSLQEHHILTQNDIANTYRKAQQDIRVQQQIYVEQNHPYLNHEDQVVFTHQVPSTSPGQNTSSGSFSGLDGQSLYCTEVLPSLSPPSQPVPVEGGGTSRRLVTVNGAASSQPVQYTIIIADPHLQQKTGSSSQTISPGATNILLNTLVQQQQQIHKQQQQQLQQQQLQQQLVAITKAGGSFNNFISSSNASIIVNNSSLNGSNKLSTLLNNGNNGSNLTNGGSITNPPLVTANLVDNNLNNNNLDGKSISFSISSNSKYPAAVFDSGGSEGGIVILNYTDSGESGTATLANINQLVSVHSTIANSNIDFIPQGSNHLVKAVSDKATILCADDRGYSNNHSHSYEKPDTFHIKVASRNSDSYDHGQVVEKESLEYSESEEAHHSHITQVLNPGEAHQQESNPQSDQLSRGMHSGRIGAGSGQTQNNHQQQQHHSPTSSATSAASSSQGIMLSAGQPAVPSGIFRTGTESSSAQHRLSGNTNYVPQQYPNLYGVHGQAPGHLTTLQPYPNFFQATSGHVFSHNALMTASPQSHYPHIESYSAMLASMGSHVQHRSFQGSDRVPRLQTPGSSLSQRPFHSTSTPGTQYPTITCTPPHRHSGSNSPSPGPPTGSHNPSTPSLSSHHLEKLAAVKGGSSHQARDDESRCFGEAPNVHEDKASLSPPSPYLPSGHVPKVSFDSVVKEYGGRDSPSMRGDGYFRPSLSGKEGSLKHRILTRPSDSEMGDDLSKVSGVHGLKDEPMAKRAKVSAPVSYSAPATTGLQGEGHRSNSHHLTSSHPSNNNNNNNNLDNHSVHYSDSPVGQSYQPHLNDDSTGSRYKQKSYHTPSPSWTSSPSSPSSDNPPSHLQYPTHFMKGSIIQLADGTLKRVEDLQTEDFVNSAEISSDLKVDSSTVVKIEEHPDRGTAMLSFSVGEHRVQVTVEATLEHPFFVFGQGWSSCSVSRTLARYGLDCQKLNVGDVCISLTHKDVNLKAVEMSQQQQDQQSYLGDPPSQQEPFSPSAALSASSSSTAQTTTSSSPSLPVSSPVQVKTEGSDSNFLPPSSVSMKSLNKRRLSQTELPPPQSNIVPVRKESGSHGTRRKVVPHRNESEPREQEEDMEEEEDSDSTSSLRQRRWSAPDPGTVKADQERERERLLQADEAQKAEEASQKSSSDHQ
ncbi:hybrid signal transduction histidine kinase A-like isoform X2 [Physella acuta]|uniref:hybrid signal transduction histidine kinase A-like isoform X2 n=1 Tax=Physella acuta TaxID=109671 RepID=UPI0027DBCCA4|nr:hybrid signal transduction histidine kinase A-like isoform X2 [Physella acuta]